MAIGLVDVLFLTFGALQIGWLFGGTRALASAGVTVAEYARHGFFELVAVAAMALPLLLVAHAVAVDAPAGTDGARRGFRWASGALIALVLVLLVSAADRMRLYQAAFGLTEARFYASALMGWLGLVFVWAAVTLRREQSAPFALGALLSAWVWVLALHAADPDARIVRVNAARMAAGHALDADYLRGLSADATPALVQLARALPATADPAVRCAVASAVATAARRSERTRDWRAWSVSRARARAALARAAVPAPASVCPPSAVGSAGR